MSNDGQLKSLAIRFVLNSQRRRLAIQIYLYFGVMDFPLLALSIILFGAFEPGYSHVHMSVSQLDALSASNTLAMNLFGLFIPGICVAVADFSVMFFYKIQWHHTTSPPKMQLS